MTNQWSNPGDIYEARPVTCLFLFCYQLIERAVTWSRPQASLNNPIKESVIKEGAAGEI